MHTSDKDSFRNFLKGTSPSNGDNAFLESGEISDKMLSQWDDYSDVKSNAPSPDFNKLFSKVSATIDSKDSADAVSYKKTLPPENNKRTLLHFSSKINWLAAASVFLGLILVGGLAYQFRSKTFSFGGTVEFATTKGQKKDFLLADGTRVWLNADSKITYFKSEKKFRHVKLVGEAFFDVVKNAEKPFIVETSQLSIKVLGTKFNIKAYSDDKTIETTLESGLICLQQKDRNSEQSNTLIIKPQQKATFNKDNQKLLLEDVESKQYTSWKEGQLIFDNEDIHEAIKKIERWFGVEITILDGTKNDRITLTVKDETIDEVIKLLQYTTSAEFKVEKADGSETNSSKKNVGSGR